MECTISGDRLRALSNVWLFAYCDKKELRQLARLCTEFSVDEGFVLITEGKRGHECFVIVEGKAQVSIGARPVGVVGAGECVGEMALLDRGPRTATVTARTPMTLYVLSPAEFHSMLEVSPTIATKIATSLARRLRAYEADQPTEPATRSPMANSTARHR